MAEPQHLPQTTPEVKSSVEETAAKMAADNKMARVDPLALMINQVSKDYQTLGQIFDEKARRLEEKNKNVPVDQQELPDAAELKALVDAGATAAQLIIEYRREQREEIMFGQMRKPQKEKDSGMEFETADKKTKRPPARPDTGFH